MTTKSERLMIRFDAAQVDVLARVSDATGASIAELIRRAVAKAHPVATKRPERTK